MSDIAKWIDDVLDTIQAVLLSVLIKLGPFAVALMPALFSGYAIYHTFADQAGPGLAMLFAVVVALAIETVGIVLAHTSIEMYNGFTAGVVDGVKLGLIVLLIPFYLVGVAGVVIYADGAFTPLVQALGVASPFLTCAVYVAVALARDYARIEQRLSQGEQIEAGQIAAERQHERDLARQRLAMDHERQLKQDELQARVQIEQVRATAQASTQLAHSKTEPAQASFACPDCGRDNFATIQAVNAHKRFCDGTMAHVRVKGNGTGH